MFLALCGHFPLAIVKKKWATSENNNAAHHIKFQYCIERGMTPVQTNREIEK